MTDKEFRKLSRSELIEIIYQLQKNEEEYKKTIAQLDDELKSKRIKIENAGSIAEAVVGLNDIFLKAQEAADQYLEEIHAANSNVEERAKKIMLDATQQAAKMITDAKLQSAEIKAKTDKEVKEKWIAVNKKVEELLKAKAELSSLLK